MKPPQQSPATPFLLLLLTLFAALPASAQIVINEIHYDPPNRTRREEFIELYNAGTEPVNLNGWTLTDAVEHVFGNVTIPPGGYYCVVENAGHFSSKWPGVTAFAAWQTGKLSNQGERIRLKDAAGTIVDEVTYGAGFPWPTASRGAGASMQLLHPALDNDLGGSWRATGTVTTPGAANSVLLATPSGAPPAPRQVAHSPRTPKANEPVTITVKVTDPDGVASVDLRYQKVDPGSYIRKTDSAFTNPANWTTLPMSDDGLNGDAAAGDGVYTAVIPAEVQTHRRLVRYQIVVADALGNSVQIPYADDEQPNFAYFVYNGVPDWSGALRPSSFSGSPATPVQTFPASVINSIPPWHLIANSSDVINSQYNSGYDARRLYGTLVHDGQVYDHIQYSNRGIGSTYVSGKNKWVLRFNRARDFQPKDNWGRPFKETWDSVALNACASPWAAVHRGSAGVEEASSYRLFELCGVPALRTTYVHWRIIRKAEEVYPATARVSGDPLGTNIYGQYAGDLWGLYMALEPTEGNFLDERDLEDGNLYSIEGGSGDKKHQGATHPTNTSDWTSFNSGVIRNGQTEQWYRDNLDLQALYTFIAISRLVGNTDVRPGDNYRFYHRPGDNRWVILPYDLDMMYIAAHHWGGTMDGVTVAGAPNAIRAIMRHPALALEFRNRCRELLSLVASDPSPNGGQIGQLIDEYAQMVNPAGQELTWADLDAALWNLHPRTAGGGDNTGQTSHKGNFFRALYRDGTRGGLDGTLTTTSWIRELPVANPGDKFSDHEGLMKWFVDFVTNTWPEEAGTWVRKATSGPGGGSGVDNSVHRQKGYGYKYLEWESIYGGYANANVNPPASRADLDFPNTPTIQYIGKDGFPADDLRFTSSPFSDPQGADTAEAVQWRIGEISAPGIPGYDPTKPRVYEIEEVWTSEELPLAGGAVAEVKVPASAVHPGRTYRARVRHKDNTGRWSAWSPPVQFLAGEPETNPWSALRVTEINYNPGPLTSAEVAAPGWNPLWDKQIFEFIELQNTGSESMDLGGFVISGGLDYTFPEDFTLPPGGFTVVAKHRDAFLIRYPHAAAALAPGDFRNDSLSNSGEEIIISASAGGAPLIRFTYSDKAPWPEEPDGDGPTLVLANPSKADLDHNDPAEWRAGKINGTPGEGEDTSGGGVTWEQWILLYPGTDDPAGDNDGDGLTNLMEFALGSNPLLPSGPAPVTADWRDGRLTFTFTRSATAAGVTRTVQFSHDLQTWTEDGALVDSTDNEDGTVTETWQASAPAEGAPARVFVRLKVTRSP